MKLIVSAFEAGRSPVIQFGNSYDPSLAGKALRNIADALVNAKRLLKKKRPGYRDVVAGLAC